MAVRRIAVEEAFVTPEIMAQWHVVLAGRDVEPGFAKMGESILAQTPANKPLDDRLLDIGAGRIAHMDSIGIDMHVLSLTSPGVQVFDGPLATRLAADSNDALAAAVEPIRRGSRACRHRAPGPDGCGARDRAGGREAWPLWGDHQFPYDGRVSRRPQVPADLRGGQARDMPIYLHPREPAPSMVTPFLDYGLYFAGWGFAAETGLHAMRLIMSGTFDRFPKLRIVLGHMGEGLPFWLQRIDNRYLLEVKIGAVDKLPKLPSEYFLDNFVITTAGVTSMPALRLCLDVLGVERILFAADFPYEDDAEAVRFMDGAAVTEDERKQIYETNARRVFKLKA